MTIERMHDLQKFTEVTSKNIHHTLRIKGGEYTKEPQHKSALQLTTEMIRRWRGRLRMAMRFL
jgi:hypothetical protein